MSDFITVEDGDGIGRGGQGMYQRAQDIRANLSKLVGDLESSEKDWQGVSGSAFASAKKTLFDKFDLIVASLGSISVGLGQSQLTVNTADDTSNTEVTTAGRQTDSVLTRPITANV